MNHQPIITSTIKSLTFILILSFCYTAKASDNGHSCLKWQKEGICIVLKDHLNVPEMTWPNTLLEYQVDFSAEPVNPGEVILVDAATNKTIPFQFVDTKQTNGEILSATLCFFSDLPSGGQKEYRLTKKSQFPKAESTTLEFNVKNNRTQLYTRIDNGLLRIDIPNPGIYNHLAAPVIRMGDATHWLGKAEMPAGLSLKQLEVTEVSAGNLLTEYSFDYLFDNDRNYRLTLRVVAGMEYVEMEEDMSGFTAGDSLSWNIVWDQFSPQYRYCPNRPGAPAEKNGKGYDNFTWETIDGSPGNPDAVRHPEMPYDQQNLPDGKLPIKITPYHNWLTWWRLHTAAFWNEQTGQTIGIFIKDFEKWIDPAYPLWGSKDNMAVHFYYKDAAFRWSFPMVTGKRSIALTIYPHQKDKQLVDRTNKPVAHVDYLRKWYGWVSLNKTKGWILDYGQDKSQHPVFFKTNASARPQDLLRGLTNELKGVPNGSERTSGPSPVQTRSFFGLTEQFEQTEAAMTMEEYCQARAIYLFMAYVYMDEALMPMQTMLSGHPNFLADIKAVPAMAAFLFPDHPHAQQMADHFEKSVALNLRYHTRPDEPAWDAKGGRSTENMACYTWAFLRPTLKPAFLLHHGFDGKNRMLQPNISLYAGWLLNGLTTPLDNEGGKRGLPPQGAHARYAVPSNLLYLLGQELKYYDPLLSENLLWVSSPESPYFESKGNWEDPMMAKYAYTGGTNPHLASAKYTGYGVTLRSGFGSSDEVYVHLQQIDAGPNYRWGRAARGGNGIIYYNAQGKRYSHNGIEDVGDAPFGDTERCTNFGVKKEKSYRSIGDYRSVGMNDLIEPLYDFGFAQFASVLANEEAAPEYRSRSILMSGSDYILVFDDVHDGRVEGRFSWFTGKDEDFPFIHQLTPGVKYTDANIQPSVTPYHKDPEVLPTKGRYYDGNGDFLTLVTHRADIRPVAEGGAYRVAKSEGSVEWCFRSDRNISFDKKHILFDGQAGLIRQSKDGKTFEAALFLGSKIGVPGIAVEWVVPPSRGGISLKKDISGYSGIFQVTEVAAIRFAVKDKLPKGLIFYLDGKETALTPSGKNVYTINIPSGKHHWQWTNKGVVPQAPVIIRSVTGASRCNIGWSAVAGASSYMVEKSADGGKTWNMLAENIGETQYNVSGLSIGTKIHVRVIAKGSGGLSKPSADYPVYASVDKPHAPEGLQVVCSGNQARLNWGQILGVDQYNLYQRKKGAANFLKVYSGNLQSASVNLPGKDIYEFAVTAVNDNGESSLSVVADTDPGRLINRHPIPGEVFRRDTESHENGYIEYNHWIEQEMPVLQYPFQTK